MPKLPLRTGFVSFVALVALGAALVAGPAPAAAQGTEPDVYISQAVFAFEARKYDEALGYLKEALALDPKNAEAHYYTGLVLLAQQKPREGIAALEQARDEAPDDQAILYQLGLAYFGQKSYRKAEGPFEQVFKAAPKTEGVGYYLGFARYNRGDYKGALEAFRAGASSDPDVQQLTKVYTSLALSRLGQTEQAKSEAEQAISVSGASAVTTTVADRLRQTVATGGVPDQRFNAEVRFGILYDTNVAVLPRPSRDPAAEFARTNKKADSFGELYSLSLSYTFLRTGPWEAYAGFSFFRVQYNEEPDFNTNNVLLSIGGSFRDSLFGMPWNLGVLYTYDDTSLASHAFLSRHTGSAAWTLVENAGNASALQFRFQDKDFSQIENDLRQTYSAPAYVGAPGFPAANFRNELRSADNWMVGVVHLFRFEADKHYVRLGFQYDSEDADGRNYSYDGYRYLVGGQYTLPWYKIRTKYDFDLHQRYYRDTNTILNDDSTLSNFQFCHHCPFTRKREDTEQNHTLTFELPLPYNLTLQLQQLWTVVDSNIKLFQYSRSVTSLSLSWRY